MADTILPGYLTTIGNKYMLVVDHFGPASYPTGGETITAAQYGIGGIDFIDSTNDINQGTVQYTGVSFSGTYYVDIKLATTTAPGGSVSSLKAQWFVVATGAEVANTTNLSAEKIRLRIMGV